MVLVAAGASHDSGPVAVVARGAATADDCCHHESAAAAVGLLAEVPKMLLSPQPAAVMSPPKPFAVHAMLMLLKPLAQKV